jgi:hypothetical protein
MRESVLGKTTRRAEDEGEAASYLYSCKAARAAPNRSGRAKPKEAAHRDVDYGIKMPHQTSPPFPPNIASALNFLIEALT